jgi:hypothetical protein
VTLLPELCHELGGRDNGNAPTEPSSCMALSPVMIRSARPPGCRCFQHAVVWFVHAMHYHCRRPAHSDVRQTNPAFSTTWGDQQDLCNTLPSCATVVSQGTTGHLTASRRHLNHPVTATKRRGEDQIVPFHDNCFYLASRTSPLPRNLAIRIPQALMCHRPSRGGVMGGILSSCGGK